MPCSLSNFNPPCLAFLRPALRIPTRRLSMMRRTTIPRVFSYAACPSVRARTHESPPSVSYSFCSPLHDHYREFNTRHARTWRSSERAANRLPARAAEGTSIVRLMSDSRANRPLHTPSRWTRCALPRKATTTLRVPVNLLLIRRPCAAAG